MLGLSADTWGAIGTILGLFGAFVSAVNNRIAAADKRAHDLEMDGVRDSFDRLESSQKASWVHVDDLRINAVRRQDQDRLREEFRADVRALGDRLEAAIAALRDDIHRDRPGGS